MLAPRCFPGISKIMSARENVALIGFMGTGKSSIGRIIARKLNWNFFDIDQLVVAQTGAEIAEIFAAEGEDFFRDSEMAALRSRADESRQIIATGGGIVLRAENVSLLRSMSFVVWLTASEEVIFERVSRTTKRPLLHTPDPRATVVTLLAARRPLYESAAHFSIDTSTRSHTEIADAVISEARRFFSCEK